MKKKLRKFSPSSDNNNAGGLPASNQAKTSQEALHLLRPKLQALASSEAVLPEAKPAAKKVAKPAAKPKAPRRAAKPKAAPAPAAA